MKPETHTCACGFTWEHGKSGSHECGPYYRKKIESLERRRSLMSVALSDASAKVEQFALENAALERQVEDLKEQRERTKSSLATVSHALSYAESQASEWRCKAGGMENELRRRELDCAELKEALQAAIAWIDAVPPDAPLPTMPGFDRDWADGLLEETKGANHD